MSCGEVKVLVWNSCQNKQFSVLEECAPDKTEPLHGLAGGLG